MANNAFRVGKTTEMKTINVAADEKIVMSFWLKILGSSSWGSRFKLAKKTLRLL